MIRSGRGFFEAGGEVDRWRLRLRENVENVVC